MIAHRLLPNPKEGLPMRPPLWHPPLELSTAEQGIIFLQGLASAAGAVFF
jgi:hypothetical protein